MSLQQKIQLKAFRGRGGNSLEEGPVGREDAGEPLVQDLGEPFLLSLQCGGQALPENARFHSLGTLQCLTERLLLLI